MNVNISWKTLTRAACSDILYQVGGALRRLGETNLALDAEKIAAALYPGAIKSAPIVPRTTT